MFSVVAGLVVGGVGGVAYAKYEHTYNNWSHGIDGNHVYMTRVSGGPTYGTVAFIWYLASYCGGTNLENHSGETEYYDTHIHVDGYSGPCKFTVAGHFSAGYPYLGHHEHRP